MQRTRELALPCFLLQSITNTMDSLVLNRPSENAGADEIIPKHDVLRPLNIDDVDVGKEKKVNVLFDDVSGYIGPPNENSSTRIKRFRMIVFDKDGTLGNDRDSLRRWAEEMTSRARAELLQSHCDSSTNDIGQCLSKIHSAIGWDYQKRNILPSALLASGTWEEILEEFAENLTDAIGNNSTRCREILDKVASWHAEIGSLHSNDAPIIDNLPAVIQTCQSHDLIVAVCTSDDRKSTDAALGHWNIASLVNYSICGDEVTNGKPSPDPLLQLCKQAGLEPQECIVVGDTIADTGMARNAGAGLCIGVLSGSGERQQLMKTGAHMIVSDVGALPRFLQLLLH